MAGEAFPVAFMVIAKENHYVIVAGLEVNAADLRDSLDNSLSE